MRRFVLWAGLLVCLFQSAAAEEAAEETSVMGEAPTLDGDDDGTGAERWEGSARFRWRQTIPREESPTSYGAVRVRLRRGSTEDVGVSVLRPADGPPWSASPLERAGAVKAWGAWTEKGGRRGIVAGNYTLSYGQGLLFYDRFGEFARPILPAARGPRADTSSAASFYPRGAALRWSIGRLTADLFGSHQSHIVSVTTANVVDADLLSLRSGAAGWEDPGGEGRSSVGDRRWGGRLSWNFDDGALGVTASETVFDRSFEPTSATFADRRRFRGSRLRLAGVDGEGSGDGWRLAGEAALSSAEDRRGLGAAGTLLRREPPWSLWATLFRYDADFISPWGKGPAFAVLGLPEELPQNQRGMTLGIRRESSRAWGRGEWTLACFPEALGVGNGNAPRSASGGRSLFLESGRTGAGGWTVMGRFQRRDQTERSDLRGAVAVDEKARFESTWVGWGGWRLRGRWEGRRERSPDGDLVAGRLVLGEISWSGQGWRWGARHVIFRSPAAYLTTGVEEIWNGVTYPLLAGGMNSLRGESGVRTALIVARRTPGGGVWVKYDVNDRAASAVPSAQRRRTGIHLQTDLTWGK